MPQVPLFVSSAGEATQNGSTTIRFQQPLEIPAGAKDATVHVSTATVPYTMPNVTAETNTLVVTICYVSLRLGRSTYAGTSIAHGAAFACSFRDF